MDSNFEWSVDTFLQAGDRGIVFVRGGKSYETAFVEAFVPGGMGEGFFRGEGGTIAVAEVSAWEKYQKALNCPGHEWEARGYTNGGGFCIHCNKFGSKVFTGEQLGQYCDTCGLGTVYTNERKTANQFIDGTTDESFWFCSDHSEDAHAEYLRALLEANALESKLDSETLRMTINRLQFLLDKDNDYIYQPETKESNTDG